MISREELESVLRSGYRSMIVEANEWRPLVDHIFELARQGYFNTDTQDTTDNIKSSAGRPKRRTMPYSHGPFPRPDCKRESCPICDFPEMMEEQSKTPANN